MDMHKQKLAEEAVSAILAESGEKLHAGQAALLSMTPDGAVRAMVGGKSYGESQYNRAAQAKRQPGSSFKLFVYLAGLEAGLTPESELEDKPITLGRWSPRNYTGEYKGIMKLRDAVAQSINTIAVQVSEMAGRANVAAMASRLGITSEVNPSDGSIALGTSELSLLELTTAYAHMATDGRSVFPFAIREIRNKKGIVLYQREDPGATPVISANTVHMMNSMLMGVMQYGTGTRAAIGRPAAGKTGTASDYKDAWFMGFTPDLVTGVWVGNDDSTPMKKVTGGALPAAIWRQYMQEALAGTPPSQIQVGYSAGLGQLMPWLEGGGDRRFPPPVSPAAEQEPESDGAVGVFDRILGGGSVEYEYPTKDRRR
jgi:penicillin-binding protein 1A